MLARVALACFWLFWSILAVCGETLPTSNEYDVLAQSQVERALREVSQVKVLVEQGTLPRTRLIDAQNHLADAQDQLVLVETLYGPGRLQDMTTEQANAMVEAAQRRVDRQDKIVQSKQDLVAAGILANSDLVQFKDELASRKQVLELANDRVKLLSELKDMANAEKQVERSASGAASLAHVMIRYNGSGSFTLKELSPIEDDFQRKFHRPLPISAIGETRVHEAMGLDHRNRVDVALSPDGVEGLWLRQLLERLRIPYLAFRSAVVGAATAPHIHIGDRKYAVSADSAVKSATEGTRRADLSRTRQNRPALELG